MMTRLETKHIDSPVIVIQAPKDAALPPAMSEGMEALMPKLTRRSVATKHWALLEAPDEVNKMIQEWLQRLDSGQSKM